MRDIAGVTSSAMSTCFPSLPARATLPSDHFIVARANGRLIALHADHALELAAFPAGAIGAVETADCPAQVARWGDGMVLVHSADELARPGASIGGMEGPGS